MAKERVYGNKYIVQHRNGKPLKGRYFVLNLDSKTQIERERSRKAMQLYIKESISTDPGYALELLKFFTEAAVES